MIKIELYTENSADTVQLDDKDSNDKDSLEWFKDMWVNGKKITVSGDNKLIAGFDLSKYKAFKVIK